MHIACAVGAPVIALHGPTDPEISGPSAPDAIVLRHAVWCSPCYDASATAECRFGNPVCMKDLAPSVVFAAARKRLCVHRSPDDSRRAPHGASDTWRPLARTEPIQLPAHARILAIRVGDMGDALLATPMLRALRTRYPAARIDLLLSESAATLLAECPLHRSGVHASSSAVRAVARRWDGSPACQMARDWRECSARRAMTR